jgi:uncharacterized protein YodC (DUF2158 family)
MDYFSACESIPPKHRFAVGQKVRIVGPMFGRWNQYVGMVGFVKKIDRNSAPEIGFGVSCDDGIEFWYPASSLAPITEVPAPRFKRGDKVQRVTGGVQLTVTGIEYDGKVWVYIFHTNNTTLVIAEEYLSPAEPVYLPTRYIFIDRDKDHNGYWDSGYATEENTGDHTHILHDMPADENGVQVDFVTLTEAGYAVSKNVSDTFSWRPATKLVWEFGGNSAIDAWRAAARHYLENREKK